MYVCIQTQALSIAPRTHSWWRENWTHASGGCEDVFLVGYLCCFFKESQFWSRLGFHSTLGLSQLCWPFRDIQPCDYTRKNHPFIRHHRLAKGGWGRRLETARNSCPEVLLLHSSGLSLPRGAGPHCCILYTTPTPSIHMRFYFYNVINGGDRTFFNQHFWLSGQGIHISFVLSKGFLPFPTHQESRNHPS